MKPGISTANRPLRPAASRPAGVPQPKQGLAGKPGGPAPEMLYKDGFVPAKPGAFRSAAHQTLATPFGPAKDLGAKNNPRFSARQLEQRLRRGQLSASDLSDQPASAVADLVSRMAVRQPGQPEHREQLVGLMQNFADFQPTLSRAMDSMESTSATPILGVIGNSLLAADGLPYGNAGRTESSEAMTTLSMALDGMSNSSRRDGILRQALQSGEPSVQRAVLDYLALGGLPSPAEGRTQDLAVDFLRRNLGAGAVEPAQRLQMLGLLGAGPPSLGLEFRERLQNRVHTALDALDTRERATLLTEALTGSVPAAAQAANQYLASNSTQAAEYLGRLASDPAINEARFAEVLGQRISAWPLHLAFRKLTEAENALAARSVFRRLGEARYAGEPSQQAEVLGLAREVVGRLSIGEQAQLFHHIATDTFGQARLDPRPNSGQRLAAELLSSRSEPELRGMLDTLPESSRQQVSAFLRSNVGTAEAILALEPNTGEYNRDRLQYANSLARNLIGGNAQSPDAAAVAAYANAYRMLRPREVAEHLRQLGPENSAQLVWRLERSSVGSENPTLDRLIRHLNVPDNNNEVSGGEARGRMIGALATSLVRDRDATEAQVQEFRQRTRTLLSRDGDSAIRSMSTDELHNLVRLHLQSPPDLSLLQELVRSSEVSSISTARIAVALNSAYPQVLRQTRTGTATDDILRGLTVNGSISGGIESETEDATTHTGEAGVELGLQWSANRLAVGSLERDANQINESVTSLMNTLTERMNLAGVQERDVFRREMGSLLTIVNPAASPPAPPAE